MLLVVGLLAGPIAAAGGKVRVEFPGRKLAAERKGKRVDYMHLKPGENLTVHATGPARINLRVCRVFNRGGTRTVATSLIVARDDGMVARVALDLVPGKGAPLPHDRKLELSQRGAFQIQVDPGDHIYVVTTDTAEGLGLAVRVTKGKKPKRNILAFAEPGSVKPPRIPVVKVEPPAPEPVEPKPKEPVASANPELSRWSHTDGSEPEPEPEPEIRPAPTTDAGDEVIHVPVAEPSLPPPREGEGVNSAVFWTAASAGVVAALASGGMRVWYRQQDAAYREKSELNAPDHETREIRDRMVMLERMYIGFAAVAGAAGLTAGIVAIFTDWDDEEGAAAKTTVAPALMPGGGGVSVRIEF